jgi:hypothetical protein
MKSEFGEWFRSQAGPQPMTNKAAVALRERISDLRLELADAEHKLSQYRNHEIARQYALYAWTARDAAKRAKRRAKKTA